MDKDILYMYTIFISGRIIIDRHFEINRDYVNIFGLDTHYTATPLQHERSDSRTGGGIWWTATSIQYYNNNIVEKIKLNHNDICKYFQNYFTIDYDNNYY